MKHLLISLLALVSIATLYADSPIQKNEEIHVAPGDSIILQFTLSGKKLSAPKVVDSMEGEYCIRLQAASTFAPNIVPEKVDSVFKYMMGKSPDHTLLSVQKNFEPVLNYDCKVRRAGKKKESKRNNLAVKEQLPMVEQYPEKLDLIVLSKFWIE